MTVKERIKEFIEYKNISVRAFEKSCNLSFGYIHNMRVSIQPDKITSIATQYPELNTGWLLTGEGSMIKNNDNYNMQNANKSIYTGVPFYNIDVTLGFLETFETKEVAEYFVDYKPFNDCTAYLPVYGDSMFPKFRNGEVIAVKQISNFDILLWGEAYLVITNSNANNLRTVKLLFQHSDFSKMILRASNPSYPGDTIIDKVDIVAIYSVRGKISRDFI